MSVPIFCVDKINKYEYVHRYNVSYNIVLGPLHNGGSDCGKQKNNIYVRRAFFFRRSLDLFGLRWRVMIPTQTGAREISHRLHDGNTARALQTIPTIVCIVLRKPEGYT